MAKELVEAFDVDDEGWTEWIHPVGVFTFICCDCGLAHDLEFSLDDINQLVFRVKRTEEVK